jgi:hypothetical protein
MQAQSLYDRDFAAWVGQQVELLRSGQAAALDVSNLIEELEGLTKRDERALGSQLKRIMAHLLKQRINPSGQRGAGRIRSRTAVRKSPTSWNRARACVGP